MKIVRNACLVMLGLVMSAAGASADLRVLAPGEARELRKENRLSVQAKKKKKKNKTLGAQCRTIKSVNFLIKADTSTHIPGGDRRKGSYSVIGSRSNCRPCPSGRCNILYKDGTQAGAVGYYGQWSRSHGGNGCARYYGGAGSASPHSASRIISTARGKGRKLYLQSGTTCYEWNSDLRRVGNP